MANGPNGFTMALWNRLQSMSKRDASGHQVIHEFGLFVDTHRDQPHVGNFDEDIHRGTCKPTMVDYDLDADTFIEVETGKTIKRHRKHLFVDPEWLAGYETNLLMQGNDLRNQEGYIATSHLRDARAQRYHMWSFRQAAMDRRRKP